MSFFLLDECVAKCCVNGSTIYTAQRSVEVRGLGYSASDADIYTYAKQSDCVIVTLNGYDYAHLAVRNGPTPVIVLPHVVPAQQHDYLKWVAPLAHLTFAETTGRFVEVSSSGRAISYQVGQGFDWDIRPANRDVAKPRMIH